MDGPSRLTSVIGAREILPRQGTCTPIGLRAVADTAGNPGGGEPAPGGGSVGDYGYSGGYGYGPGYGDPGSDEGYGCGRPGRADLDNASGHADGPEPAGAGVGADPGTVPAETGAAPGAGAAAPGAGAAGPGAGGADPRAGAVGPGAAGQHQDAPLPAEPPVVAATPALKG